MLNSKISLRIIKDEKGNIIFSDIAQYEDDICHVDLYNEDGEVILQGEFRKFCHVSRALEDTPYTTETYTGVISLDVLIECIEKRSVFNRDDTV